MDKPQNNPNFSSSTTSSRMEGQELGEEEKIWREVATSEARLALMKNMVREQLAFTDLEEFGIIFDNKLKSKKLKNQKIHSKLTDHAMRLKIADEQALRRDLVKMRTKMKRNLAKKYGGEKVRGYKRAILHLNNINKEVKSKLQKKYKAKMEHLKNKYRMKEEDKIEEIPEDMENYETLSVFSDKKYKNLKKETYDVLTIGDVSLNEDEKAVLKLHNKFSVLENIKKGGIDGDQEAAIAKLRMEKTKDEEYEGYTEEERKEDEILNAQNRMIYDPCERVFDGRKRRVTDLKECARVTLPKPLSAEEESKIEVRKRTQKEVFEKFRKMNTNSRGEQTSNLNESEQRGLKSLKKRIKEGEIIVMKTDKSGRFVVTTPENYVEMGKEHTDKDIEIGWEKVRQLEKTIHSHSMAWAQIWSYGDDHNHQDRILRSKIARSGNQANLTLLYKDHKLGNKTRPVASGNESFNLGLSNGVSELLESVFRAIRHPYSVISSEDMLARVSRFNEEKKHEKTLEDITSTTHTGVEDDDEELKTGDHASKTTIPHQLEATVATGTDSEGLGNEDHTSKTTIPPKVKATVPTEIDEEILSLVGSDVIALFPSITADNTGKIIREQIIRSEIKLEGLDTEKARAYIVINKDEITDIEDLENILPIRKSNHGTSPTMASITSKWNPTDQWVFPPKIPTQEQERKIAAVVAEIALKALFNNFTYKFGGKNYHQQSGGPIGVRATMAASNLVMEDWAVKYKNILVASGIVVKLMAGYVDDGRQVTSVLRKGMRYTKETNKFEHNEEAEQEDVLMENKGETNNQRMARVCIDAMNSVNTDLQFTSESQEDFNHERLPTLDFELWLNEEMELCHSYYQKPTKTPYVLMERSGMAYHQKFQILSNELCRRLSNIQIGAVEHQEILQKIEQFIGELNNSGYSRKQAREIVCSGVRGWQARIKKRKRKNISFYRLAESTVNERLQKELTERECWYKNEDNENEEGSPNKKMKMDPLHKITRTRKSFNPNRKNKIKTNKTQVKSVMFVPHTRKSELANILREKEEKLVEVTGNKVKIVERAGNKLENILAGKDPWKGKDCERKNCFICNTKVLTGKDLNKDCTKKNIIYEIRCLTCEETELEKIENLEEASDEQKIEMKKKVRKVKYVGESSRSGYDRGYEHLDKLATLNSDSHMLKHMVEDHYLEDFEKVKWGMFITRFMRTAFERQIEEAVTITREAENNEILNSRAEWNQCALPRLTTRMGDIGEELKKWEKEMEDEKKKEEKIEEKIRNMRRKMNKARLMSEKPASKRLKTQNENYISIRDTWGAPTITAPQKTSADVSCQEQPPEKRRKRDQSIDTRLTNCRRVEDRIIEGEEISMKKYEIETIDWDKRLEEHQNWLEEEARKREQLLNKAKRKNQSWELYRQCKEYLEKNEHNWEARKIERDLEIKRKERLLVARNKQEILRTKVKERKLDQEIAEKKEQLPKNIQDEMEYEEDRKRRIELKETCASLWKLRSKERKYERKHEQVERLERINDKEEKLKKVEETIRELKEKEEEYEREKERRKMELEKEKTKKKEIKLRKEHEKKEKLEKAKILGLRWAMLRWVTQYIKENEENWERIHNEKLENERQELEKWKKAKRFEKIEKLKKFWEEKKNCLPPSLLPPPPPSHITEEDDEIGANTTIKAEEKTTMELRDNKEQKVSNKLGDENWTVWRKKQTENDENNTTKTEISEEEDEKIEHKTKVVLACPKFQCEATYLTGKHGLVFGGPDMGVAKTTATLPPKNEGNREQNTTPDLPVFPIFKKLKEATKIKIPDNQEHGLVFGGPDMGVAKTTATLPPKITPSKPSNKKPTEKIKSNKITRYMNKQTEGNTETNADKNKKKTKPKENTRKNDKKTTTKQKQHEEEDKKLRGYWVNLARKNRNQSSKDVLSDVNQPSIDNHNTVQSYSQIQVDREPQIHVGLDVSKEGSRNIQLAAPILESGD